MNLREKYTKETGNSSIEYVAENGIISISQDYVEWLEVKFNNVVLADVSDSICSCGTKLVIADPQILRCPNYECENIKTKDKQPPKFEPGEFSDPNQVDI